MAERFAVAITMTKNQASPGTLSILTRLDFVEGKSADEALGIALVRSMVDNPDHQVFKYVCRPIDDGTASHREG